MKTALVTLLLLPLLSFGQVTKSEKKAIDNYTSSVCNCINELFDELHPKTLELILLIGEKGQDEAMQELNPILEEMSAEEREEFLGSFETMESEAFALRIEKCEEATNLKTELKDQIDQEIGAVYAYFMKGFAEQAECKLMKVLYDLGNSTEE